MDNFCSISSRLYGQALATIPDSGPTSPSDDSTAGANVLGERTLALASIAVEEANLDIGDRLSGFHHGMFLDMLDNC